MRIAAAQLAPAAGSIERNVRKHQALVELAASNRAQLVFFPEMSLTGYEPALAKELAIDPQSSSVQVFQDWSDANDLILCVGAPTVASGGDIRISMLIFQPGAPRTTYSKQYLHADELPYFVGGTEQVLLRHGNDVIAPAICYESLQPQHAQRAAQAGANIYLASVAKSASSLNAANSHYPRIARQHGLIVIMANSYGPCDNFVSVGQSTAWDRHGGVFGRLETEQEGILLTDTQDGISHIYSLRQEGSAW